MDNDLYKYENELYNSGINFIGGVDEVGRGPLIGDVVAACVVLPRDFVLDGLTDSKKLSEKKRDAFYNYIINNCVAYGIGYVHADEIDKINIYEASRKAMIKAYEEANKKVKIDYLLTDAMPIKTLDIPVLKIIKGDAKSVTIAAASILAKVTRDRILIDLDKKYPEYNFKKHKGYPTKEHLEKINEFGVFDEYRMTYKPVKNVLDRGIVRKKR